MALIKSQGILNQICSIVHSRSYNNHVQYVHFLHVSFLLGRVTVAELTAYIDTAEQKSADVTAFIRAVQKYEHITELTPEIMHELIEKIVVHAPDKSRGHRTQEIEIHYRFNVAVTTAVADSMKYNKKERLRNRIGYATLSSNRKNFFTSTRLKVEGCFLWAVRQGKNLNVTIKNAIRGRNSQERKRWATSTRASRSEQYNEQSAKYDTSKKEADRLSRLAQQKRDSQRTLARYLQNEQADKRKKNQLE